VAAASGQLVDGARGPVLFGSWLLVAAVLAAAGIAGYRRRADGLRRSSGPLDARWRTAAATAARCAGLRRAPPTRLLPGDGSPCVVGLLRPVVYVPATFAARTRGDDRTSVLLHEYAHVLRRDPLCECATVLLQVVFWFHPAVWLVRRRLATLREQACDQRAVAALGGDVDCYRRALLRCAGQLLAPPRLQPNAWLGRQPQLLARLAALQLAPAPDQRRTRALGALLTALLAACAPMLAPPPFLAGVDAHALPGCLLKRYAVFTALGAECPTGAAAAR